MRRMVVLSVLTIGAVAALASIGLATPGKGQTNAILSLGELKGDLAFNTGLRAQADGLTWNGKRYGPEQLPEFLSRLRSAGVTNLGEWLNRHPVASAKFGLVPVGLLQSPQIVTQQARFAPGATSGWHSHPGYLTATVVSGQVVRYATDCSTETFEAGHSFYETGASTFAVRNESTREAVVLVTFVVPGGTPTTGLRIDKPQPSTCGQS